jgi:FAD/FMN-containing dehydrogenase/Fe-S oxidoreductase
MSRASRLTLPVVANAPPAADRTVDVDAFRAALAQGCSGEVRFDRLSRSLYSTDASVYQIVPLGVVLPRTEADVVHTLATCARFGVPLTARGGGTSQAGQCIGAGVILDCSKYFHDLLEVNATERWARVRPGCVLDDLNLHVRPHGLVFAPDISTASRATIGGMIANNSSGTHSLIHGKTVDHVLAARVLLADGQVIDARPLQSGELQAKCAQADLEGTCYRTVRELAQSHADEIQRRYPKVLRRVGGYNLDLFTPVGQAIHPDGSKRQAGRPDLPFNLAHLFVGSEGTLGVVVEAKLGLVELPRAKALLVVQFHDLLDALTATPLILTHQPAAVEVMDRYILDATRLNPEASRLRDFLRGEPAAILIVEFYGDRADDLGPRLQALEADLRRQGLAYHYHPARSNDDQARIWKLRTLALGLSMAEKGDAKAISFVEDSAVGPSHLRDYIAELLALIARHGTTAGVYAHASVGCLHVRPVIDLKSAAGVSRFQAIAADVADLVLKYGGALSGEHGDGLVRSPFQEKMFGPVLYQAFRELKRAFDPHGLFNPGKVVDAPSLTANLRYGPAYVTPEVPTTFDFSADGGLVRAAELCAGVGECRKKRGGIMCPSYQATREEQHSTRGRANVLRLALTGQVGLAGLTDPAVREAMELCLECKACKSECPTNVDMARLKAEFLDQLQRQNGVSRRNRVLGNVAWLSRWGSRLAPVSSLLARSGPVRFLNEKLLGIDRRRLPPAFARTTFRRVFRRLPPESSHIKSRLLLLPDTFTNYHEPQVGLAAVDLFRRAGASVWLGPEALGCCGRPLISTGQLARAVRLARHNVGCLYPWAEAGHPIVACEPSCLLTMKDDYPALLRGDERRQAEAVAAVCLTFEEALERALQSAPLSFRTSPGRILVQGHCHQRALVGMGPLLRVLRGIPGAEVVDLDAGCCGMAGAFGYETEHYEVSRLVGEQRLFPALRQASADAVVAAPGFSCRLQIAHFVQREAVHTATLLRALVDDAGEDR